MFTINEKNLRKSEGEGLMVKPQQSVVTKPGKSALGRRTFGARFFRYRLDSNVKYFSSRYEQSATRSWKNSALHRLISYIVSRFFPPYERTSEEDDSADRLLYMRLGLLTLYFAAHFVLLSYHVWDHSLLQLPPEAPKFKYTALALREKLNRFIELVHPHVHGHPHLHVSLATAMRRCLGFTVLEWVALLRLTIVPNSRTRSRLFGLVAAMSSFIHISSIFFGGLPTKAVLFPDVWDYIDLRLQTNVFANGSARFEDVLRNIQPTRMPSVDTSQTIYFLNPRQYFRFSSPLQDVQDYPLPVFVLPLLYFLHVLDIAGALLYLISAYCWVHPRDLIYPAAFLSILLGISSAFLTGIPKPNAGDHHWVNFRRDHLGKNFRLPDRRAPPVRITKYILMKDGVEVAADIYLPKALVQQIVCSVPNSLYQSFYRTAFRLSDCIKFNQEESNSFSLLRTGIPTYLMVTRYNRRMTVHWPFTFLSLWGQPRGESTTNIWSWQFVDSLVANDYAFVVADTRGTGASSGNRPVDLSPAELYDLAMIHEWLTHQFWFNGQIATGGFSYDGMTGLYLAALRPVQAVLALFTPINVVHDLIQPGGLVCSAFVENYTGLTQAFETDGTPRRHLLNTLGYDMSLVAGFVLVFGHAAPVKTREPFLAIALKQHASNWNMSEMVESIHFTDDFVLLPPFKEVPSTVPKPLRTHRISANQFGITRHLVDRIVSQSVAAPNQNESRTAAVYIVGGYCDSSSVRGSVRLYEALRTAKTKQTHTDDQYRLTLGPWTHTGRRNCSPYAAGTYSHFELDMYWDVLRYLDYHLKRKKWENHVTRMGNDAAQSKKLMKTTCTTKQIEKVAADFESSSCYEPRICTAKINDSLPVHFWSVGEERWLASFTYPPEGLEEVNYNLSGAVFLFDETEETPHSTAKKLTGRSASESKLYTKENNKFILVKRLNRSICWKCLWSSIFTPRPPVGYAARARSLKYFVPQRWNISEMSQSGDLSLSSLHYQVDYNATTRGLSRWLIAKHPFRMAVTSYRQRYPSSTSTMFFPLLEASVRLWRGTIRKLSQIFFVSVNRLNTTTTLDTEEGKIDFPTFQPEYRSGVVTAPTPFLSSLLLASLPTMMKLINPRRTSTGELLTFTSDPLGQPLRVVGSPLVRFSINLTDEFTRHVHELRRMQDRSRIKVNELDPVPALDVTVFGYLEDIDPERGDVHYVTEARMLVSHRPTIPDSVTESLSGLTDWSGCASRPLSEAFSKDTVTIRQKPRLGSADVVYQNGDRGSHRFTVGGTECVSFTFEPVTWYFQKGHRVRLSLAGADRGNFQWSRTQSKEDADLLAQSLLFAVKAGNHEWFNEIQKRPVRVLRPKYWEIPLNNPQHAAFLKLASLEI